MNRIEAAANSRMPGQAFNHDRSYASRTASAVLALFLLIVGQAVAADRLTLVHVHGLSFSADGKQLLVPSHVGLAVYSDGHWSKAPGPEHDFMGFSVARDAMYSSGHPAPGSGLRNPFGLLKSRDGGKTWEILGLTGEADFHVMGASYGGRALYAYTPAANSAMPRPGIYYTLDDGKSWTRADAKGFPGEVLGIAVHPAEPGIVAVASDAGAYLSEDYGASFKPAGGRATSVYFDLDGQLWIGGYERAATLTRVTLRTMKHDPVRIPPLTKDAVSFIAQNPVQKSEFAIATFNRDVYLSRDSGKTWTRIADKGAAR